MALTDYADRLEPTYALLDPCVDEPTWLLLVKVVPDGTNLDKPVGDREVGWHTSPQARFERLLRETEIPVGLLVNGGTLRLVYAPRGESSGHITFPVDALCEVRYRELLSALLMLLHANRVIDAGDGKRLVDLLKDSRRYQNDVSTRLADQVLDALWELLRGVEAADSAREQSLVLDLVRDDAPHVYGGLITVLMRLVFLLYAEDEELLPRDAVFAQGYSVSGLYERLRADVGRYPDTMDDRYGAWAALITLFRLVYDGGGHGLGLRLPARHGQLFDPDAYPFLEGRLRGLARQVDEPLEVPKVPDGCIHRVLERLLVLDGERLSYRALDVEQIGSVYEAMMGFEVERAHGPALAIAPKHVVVRVDELLEQPASKRKSWLEGNGETKLTAGQVKGLKAADSVEDVVAALGRKVSPRTRRPLQAGSFFLQPGEERRRSGSHYTPRELTEPIVRTTLRPVLEALGSKPRPARVLALKVCDPAMGSGAFLVEACRQLAEALVASWDHHGMPGDIPTGVEPLNHARRLVAQRCLYGVDKNPFAVNLAKLSLWLITLSKDLPFTFIDHALKCGDSLVGLTLEQIERFSWEQQGKGDKQLDWVELQAQKATVDREALQLLGDADEARKRELLEDADAAVEDARLVADLCIAAFFGADKKKAREGLRADHQAKVAAWRAGALGRTALKGIVDELRGGERPVPPLHWPLEFPEVFGRPRPGFDAVVGNPPFLGGARIWPVLGGEYRDWLRSAHAGTGGKAVDLVAHFFRRTFTLLHREGAALGLIATNTVSQGDTREAGLHRLVEAGGTIYCVDRRVRWPGLASVVVSVVHLSRGRPGQTPLLDRRPVVGINSHFFPRREEFAPQRLRANRNQSFQGSIVLGMGFTFDDSDRRGAGSPFSEMHRLIETNPGSARAIFPYLGGQDLASHPKHEPRRFVINFKDHTLEEAMKQWPELVQVVRERVKPERDRLKGYSVAERRRERWWQFGTYTPALYAATSSLRRVLAIARVSNAFAFAFVKNGMVYNEKVVVFPFESGSAFCTLQARVHETWGRFFNSTLKDDMQYTPTDCYETFPFPHDWTASPSLTAAGDEYHSFRADLMVRNDEGLTKTYNRFHDPNEISPDIVRLRELHAEMDRAVLDAYDWKDIPTDCEFLLDYPIDEETWSPRKRKPYRYRWPDEVRDEVLARLLEENKRQAEEEALAGKPKKRAPRRRAPRPASSKQESLF